MPGVPCHLWLAQLGGKNQPAGSLLAECQFISNASTMRKQELMFGILKQLSARETDIVGEGVVEVLPDGFG